MILSDRDAGIARVAADRQQQITKIESVTKQIDEKIERMHASLDGLTGDARARCEADIQKHKQQRDELQRFIETFHKGVSDGMANLDGGGDKKRILRVLAFLDLFNFVKISKF